MECYICGNKGVKEILNKPDTTLWTNSSDSSNRTRKYKCIIFQCNHCGHVFQPMSEGLLNILNEIYLSNQAYLSTPMGRGNWGLERADNFLKTFTKIVDFKNCKTILEIGCADGFLLQHLKNTFNGLTELVGIEPSIDKTKQINGLTLLKDFANTNLKLNKCFDLIFSVGVFEHIENINDIMLFCNNHIKDDGKLFICVPDAKEQLKNGDPALFTHQHIHCFTEESVSYLLSTHGFEITSLTKTQDSLNVYCKKKYLPEKSYPKMISYDDYSAKLDNILKRIENTLSRNDCVMIHGVNNSLNNILNWLQKDFNFVLIDNDSTKHGKKFFGRTVKSVDDVNLSNYSALLIIPSAYYEKIKADYIDRGFNDKIETVIDECR